MFILQKIILLHLNAIYSDQTSPIVTSYVTIFITNDSMHRIMVT